MPPKNRTPAAMVLLCFAPLCQAGEPSVPARVQQSRAKETKRKTHLGLLRVEQQLFMGGLVSKGGLKLYYRAYVKPNAPDRLVLRGWAPVVFGCLLGPGYANGQWDRWTFFDAQIAVGKRRRELLRRDPLDSMSVLEQGQRAVADIVWRAAGPGGRPTLSLRVVKRADAAAWAFFQACVLQPDAALASARVSGYPHSTTPDEAKLGRRRWITTARRRQELTSRPLRLDPKREYLVLLHNRGRQEDAGLVLLFAPAEIVKAETAGTYQTWVRLTPKPGAVSIRFACSYFAGESYADAAKRLLPQAKALLARLKSIDWSVRRDAGGLSPEEAKEASELIAIPGIARKFAEPYRRRLAALREASSALARPAPSPRERRLAEMRYGRALADCRRLLDDMRREWLRILPID